MSRDQSKQGFTYEYLSEIQPDPFWTGLAALAAAGCFAVVALASSGLPDPTNVPIQAEVHESIDDAGLADNVLSAEP